MGSETSAMPAQQRCINGHGAPLSPAVRKLVAEHGKLPLSKLTSALNRVSQTSGTQRAKIAARYLRDFFLYYRDMRRLDVLHSAMEKINPSVNNCLAIRHQLAPSACRTVAGYS